MTHTSMTRALAAMLGLCVGALSSVAHADVFTHEPSGKLVSNSGKGRVDDTVYAPDLLFPIESGPAFANSQVYGHGGGSGPGGSQCDVENFSYPWHDNYCESRDYSMPLCPAGTGHQGQDIRAEDCKKGVHWVVAVADGTITQIGSYSVYLTAEDGTRYDYLHMSDVAVNEGSAVKRGQHVGKVSNQFGSSATTVHLHFNIKQNVSGIGNVFVPPYASLVESYNEHLGLSTKAPPDAGTITAIAPNEPEPPAKETKAATLPAEKEDEHVAASDSGCASTPSSTTTGSPLILLGVAIVGVVRRRPGRFLNVFARPGRASPDR